MKIAPHGGIVLATLISLTGVRAFAADIESFIEPYRSIEVAAAESGIIIGLHVKEGQKVEKDQPLAELNQDVLKVSVDIAKAHSEAVSAIRAAEAEIKLQTDRHARLVQLRAKDNATEDEVNRAQLEKDLADARLLAAKEAFEVKRLEHERIRLQLAQRTVRSPLNGYVVQVQREIGESVGLADPVVMTVVQLDPLLVTFPVPVSQLTGLKSGQTLRMKVVGRPEPIEGTLDLISPIISADSQTVKVKVVIPNTDNRIKSGSKCVLLIGTSGQEPLKLTDKPETNPKVKKQ